MRSTSVLLPDPEDPTMPILSPRATRRSIPDKAGGGICALFRYAWGAWRLGITAFVLIFVTIIIKMPAVTVAATAPPLYSR